MRVQCFPQCCGAGVLVIEHLTGKGKEADLEFIKSWVYYARRNGYRMYDFPGEYGAQSGNTHHMDSKSVMGGLGDQKIFSTHNSWGMLLAITNPSMAEAGERLQDFGFKEIFRTHNPVYGGKHLKGGSHPIVLWGLDLNDLTEAELKPKTVEAKKV